MPRDLTVFLRTASALFMSVFRRSTLNRLKKKRLFFEHFDKLTSRPLVYVLQVFGKKQSPHFFFDNIHVVNVMRQEFGYDMETFLGCRWINCSLSADPPGFRIEYQRAVQCLDEHLKDNAPLTDTNYRNFSSIIDKMYCFYSIGIIIFVLLLLLLYYSYIFLFVYF